MITRCRRQRHPFRFGSGGGGSRADEGVRYAVVAAFERYGVRMDPIDASEPAAHVGPNDDATPGPSHPSGLPPAPAGQPLSGKQRSLLEALTAKDQQLGEMYIGALLALHQPTNRERFSQAAHTLREMINRLPVALGLSTETLLKDRLGDRLQRPEQTWDAAMQKSACLKNGKWTGVIDRPLATALTAIQNFFEWKKITHPEGL